MFLFRGGDTHGRSVTKAISWRFLGSIDTFLLSWFFTSSVKAASAIAFTEVLTKMVLYYLHERAWSSFTWGVKVNSPEAIATPGATIPSDLKGCDLR